MPNRKDRRAQRAQERKGRRFASSNAAYEAGRLSAQTGELPPGYYEDVEKLARAMACWLEAEPTKPDLRWHDMTTTDTTIAGPLAGEALKYVAATPDAIRMLEWVDRETGHVGTLYQATWALKLIGQLPGGPERAKLEKRFESAAWQNFQAYVHQTGTTTRQVEHPCPHCAAPISAATGVGDSVPKPGMWNVCSACGGINRFDEQLRSVALGQEELDALDPDHRAELEEMSAIARAAQARYALRGKTKGPVPEA